MEIKIIDRRQNSAEFLAELYADEVAALSDAAREIYRNAIANGDSPQFAIGLATRQAAQLKGGDRIFLEGARAKMGGMLELNRDKICELAQKAGINTNGKFYVGGLGRYTDKHAWVSTADDVKTVCKIKNLNATGYVNHKAVEPAEGPKRVAMADDLVSEKIGEIIQSEPKTRERIRKGKLKREDLRERVIATHGRQSRR